MPGKKKEETSVARWQKIEEEWQANFPYLHAFLARKDEVSELRLKYRDDGTVLAIAKGFGEDGGPIVSFGVGYDVILALMAIDATIQGNHWRVDKPWQPGK